ncbi:MAG: hypothetical protein JWM35_1408 [Verrucomicrobia bacterium]|nr:hypothetical protein [Verrucomicrobiota bacterium]
MLVLGLSGAAVIFLSAEPERYDPLLNDPLGRKRYARQMQVIGGKANLLAADFNDWFGSLWQGRALGGTVAVITVAATLTFRFIATIPPPKSGTGLPAREPGLENKE